MRCTAESAGPALHSAGVEQVDVQWQRSVVTVEYAWLGQVQAQSQRHGSSPLLVFLHEGLGSLAMWKEFPSRLCHAANCKGLVYSRPGYGRSTTAAHDHAWRNDFMALQADELLPALLERLAVPAMAQPLWLIGHSDGASIALLHAASFPATVAGLVVLAPHLHVEDLTVHSIANLQAMYRDTDMPSRLAKYHTDADFVFQRWSRVWLAPGFRNWSIRNEVARITCPVLALQGVDDEFGTLQQVHDLAKLATQTEIIELPQCGHSPQRDQAQQVIAQASRFIQHHTGDFP